MTDEELIQYARKAREAYKSRGNDADIIRESVKNVLSNKNVYDAMKRLSEM